MANFTYSQPSQCSMCRRPDQSCIFFSSDKRAALSFLKNLLNLSFSSPQTSGLLSLFLPETHGAPLPDTPEQSEEVTWWSNWKVPLYLLHWRYLLTKRIMTVVMFVISLEEIHNRLIHLTWSPSPGSFCQRKETLAVQDKIENVIFLTERTTTITQNS